MAVWLAVGVGLEMTLAVIACSTFQLFVATPIPGDDEFVMAEFNGKTGKVPSTYLEYV